MSKAKYKIEDINHMIYKIDNAIDNYLIDYNTQIMGNNFYAIQRGIPLKWHFGG